MSVISDADRVFFRENGYVVVRGVVPRENCEAVIEAIWGFMGKGPGDREGWYTPPAGMDEYMKNQGGGWAEMFHHPSLMANRQHPGVYRAFSELLGEERLWVSYDKVACKFPHRDGYEAISGGFLHWDLDTTKLTPEETPEAWEGEGRLRRPFGVQGLLMLADHGPDTGGFRCAPENYRNLEQWLEDAPAGRNGKRLPEEMGGEAAWDDRAVTVEGKAGDLIIWDKLLLHGNGINRSDAVRFAQFITMMPAKPRGEMSDSEREKRARYVEAWRTNSGITLDPRKYEERTLKEPAPLTELGRKLLGVDSWFGEGTGV